LGVRAHEAHLDGFVQSRVAAFERQPRLFGVRKAVANFCLALRVVHRQVVRAQHDVLQG